MVKLTCRDLGMSCDAVIRGRTAEEAQRKAMGHIPSVHAKEFGWMSSREQMAQRDRLIGQETNN